MAVQPFGYLLAGGVLLSSLLMLALGGRFQQVERAAYAGARRPLWSNLRSSSPTNEVV